MSEVGDTRKSSRIEKKVKATSLKRQRAQAALLEKKKVVHRKSVKASKLKGKEVSSEEEGMEYSSSDSEYEPDEGDIGEDDQTVLTVFNPSKAPESSRNGEPVDKSLLESFNNHIAKFIWNNNPERPPLKCIYHSQKMTQWRIDEEANEVVERVKKSGLYDIAKHSFRWIDYVAVSAFVERWHPETNTFHMPFGEMDITLDGVWHILHVPIVGKCVYEKDEGKNIKTDAAINLLVEMLVDESEAKDELNGTHSVKLDWLKDKFCEKSKDESATGVVYDIVARAYLLHLLGCLVLTDESDTKVSVHYLNALKKKSITWTKKLGEWQFLLIHVGNSVWLLGSNQNK